MIFHLANLKSTHAKPRGKYLSKSSLEKLWKKIMRPEREHMILFSLSPLWNTELFSSFLSFFYENKLNSYLIPMKFLGSKRILFRERVVIIFLRSEFYYGLVRVISRKRRTANGITSTNGTRQLMIDSFRLLKS